MMGRGLSDLQKRILRMAYENRTKSADQRGIAWRPATGYTLDMLRAEFPDYDNRPADLYTAEIMRDVYKLPAWHGGPLRLYGNNFYLSYEYSGMYKSAKAAISRSTRRLMERGLLTDAWYGRWNLTPDGEAIAKQLSVNQQVNSSPPDDHPDDHS